MNLYDVVALLEDLPAEGLKARAGRHTDRSMGTRRLRGGIFRYTWRNLRAGRSPRGAAYDPLLASSFVAANGISDAKKHLEVSPQGV